MGKVRVAISDEDIDAALEAARSMPEQTRIVEAAYRPGPGLDFLMLKLSDGRRLLIPREELPELRNASVEQATDIVIVPTGSAVWWPRLDDGLNLPDFLEHRWGREPRGIAA